MEDEAVAGYCGVAVTDAPTETTNIYTPFPVDEDVDTIVLKPEIHVLIPKDKPFWYSSEELADTIANNLSKMKAFNGYIALEDYITPVGDMFYCENCGEIKPMSKYAMEGADHGICSDCKDSMDANDVPDTYPEVRARKLLEKIKDMNSGPYAQFKLSKDAVDLLESIVSAIEQNIL